MDNLIYHSFSQNHDFRVPAIISEVEIFYNNYKTSEQEQKLVVKAIWDTGATKSFISSQLAEKISVVPVEFEPVIGATGMQNAGVIDLAVNLPNKLYIPDKRIYICNLPGSIEMILGMDIIQLGDLHISNFGGKTLFSFVVPSLPNQYNLVEEATRL